MEQCVYYGEAITKAKTVHDQTMTVTSEWRKGEMLGSRGTRKHV